MKTIIKDSISELEINKSKFITLIYKINDISLINDKLLEVKNKYKDATHYCYAYIINDNRKSSDDGEPGGTAGIPIMEVLLKNDLNYILCVVVRYFGGIKLGAGGLVRAYTKAISTAILEENTINLIPGYEIEFEINYDNQKNIDYLLKDLPVKKTFFNKIKYDILIPKDKLDLISNIDYKIIKETYIEIK